MCIRDRVQGGPDAPARGLPPQPGAPPTAPDTAPDAGGADIGAGAAAMNDTFMEGDVVVNGMRDLEMAEVDGARGPSLPRVLGARAHRRFHVNEA